MTWTTNDHDSVQDEFYGAAGRQVILIVMGQLQMIRAADPQTRPQVLEILDSAQSLGLKVLRMWAFDEGPMQYNTLQRYPGQPLVSLTCMPHVAAPMSVCRSPVSCTLMPHLQVAIRHA